MFCSSCGAKNVAESNFCRQCGLKLDKAAAAKISEEAFDRAMPEEERVTALLELAYRRRKENDTEGAIGLCKEVLQLRPDSTTAHGLLGQLYEQVGERDKAVDQYEQVLKLNPGSIADRVKLDDLRDGRTPPVRRNASPVVAAVDPNGAAIRSAMIWGVGICVLIILSGAALAIAFNHQTGEAQGGHVALDRPGSTKTGTETRTKDVPPASASAKVEAERSQPGMSNTGPAFGQGSFYPTYGIPGAPTIQYASPPVYVIPPGYAPRQAAALPANTANSGKIKAAPLPDRAPSEADAGSERVRLTDSGGSGGDNHNVVIRVGGHDETKAVLLPPGKQGADPPSKIVVTPHKGPPDTTSGDAASSEAAAMIAVGQDKFNKMDYAAALNAFKSALNGANDETAYVEEQIGHCYEARTENRNALTMYEKARDAYKKLIAAGKQLDRASKGINICEQGIKICSSE